MATLVIWEKLLSYPQISVFFVCFFFFVLPNILFLKKQKQKTFNISLSE